MIAETVNLAHRETKVCKTKTQSRSKETLSI